MIFQQVFKVMFIELVSESIKTFGHCPVNTFVGRTGRAGREGKAVTFFTDEDAPYLKMCVYINVLAVTRHFWQNCKCHSSIRICCPRLDPPTA